ncbi:MAG: hypothetical protein ACOYNS_08875 [Bacteroidota bacterium]
MTKTLPKRVTVREGYQHPVLGDIGGWSAVILRSFTVGTTAYVDVEFSIASMEAVKTSLKKEFYQRRIVFTRARLEEKDTRPVPLHLPQEKNYSVSAKLQKEWYDHVGYNETDPTQFASDAAYDSDYDEEKRETMKTLVKIGAFTLLFSYIICKDEDENNGSGSNWGRGGHYS